MTAATTGKILVLRVGLAGDLAMITPALDMLLAAFPEAELHLVTTAAGRRVLGGFHPRLTRFILYDRRLAAFALRREARSLLRGGGYDRVYVFESNPHYLRLAAGAGAPVHAITPGAGGGHYVERCLAAVEGSLAAPPPRGPLRLTVTDAGREAAAALLARHGIGGEERLVGLHPTFSATGRWFASSGRGREHRVWPLDRFAALATQLVGAPGGPSRVLVDVLPEEREAIRPLAEAAGDALTVLSAPPDFQRYKALLERLDCLVSPNTGPMHLAAAVGTPVVALFSGWSPADCGPWVPDARRRVIEAGGFPAAERGLAAIPPEPVRDAVLELLASPGSDQRSSTSLRV